MTTYLRVALLCCAAANLHPAALASAETEPWLAPRNIEAFQALFSRSPFSLPTAEESSSLTDRYMLTGAMVLDGEPMVFIFDRTTQLRQMLSKKPNDQGLSLIEYVPEPDSKSLRATIRAGTEVATLSFVSSPQDQAAGAVPAPMAMQEAPPAPQQMVGNPSPPQQNPPAQRRVIRRTVITGQPPSP